MGAVLLRWYLFTLDSAYRDTISYEEKLEGLSEEEDDLLTQKNDEKRRQVEINMHKNSKVLTNQQCKRLNLEQLEEMDRFGYEMPRQFKERVMDYRETYSTPNSTSDSIHEIIEKKMAKQNHYASRNDDSDQNTKRSFLESLGQVKSHKNEWNSRKVGPVIENFSINNDGIKNQVVSSNSPAKNSENTDNYNADIPVKIPRMKAGLYNLHKDTNE